MNLTVPLVRLTQLVIEKTQRTSTTSSLEHHQHRRTPFVPFCLSNQTGVPLRFRQVADSAFERGVDLAQMSVGVPFSAL